MSSFATRLVKSYFIYWTLAALLILSYFFRFDINVFRNQAGQPLISRIFAASEFRNLSLGIDLQGGTRLVLKVDVEQAVDNRLAENGKSIEKILRKNKVRAEDKKIVNRLLTLKFSNLEAAVKAMQICKAEFPELVISQTENVVTFGVSAGEISRIKVSAIERSVDVLRNRLDTLNVKGLTVNRHGDASIVVQLPGVDDMTDIKDAIMRAARLEFRLVQDHARSRDSLYNKFDGILPSDKVVMDGDKAKEGGAYLVSLFPDVVGTKLTDAFISYDDRGAVIVQFKLDSDGGREMAEVTSENTGRQLAIIMDGVVISAPRINSEIGRSGIITGMGSAEAKRLAKLLRSGALEAPLKIEHETRVGASLGHDSILQGLTSCLIALLFLLIFSLVYYKTAGLLAMIALCFNLVSMLAMLALCGATLTLTGIAGMVLTVGMAIDCSILIYEKIKEEMRNHVDFRRAVTTGFAGASAVIIDSNITTFLAGVVLFWYGGPAVRGFAVTLMLGVISTLLTGVYFLRSIFDFIIDNLGFKKISI